MNLDEYTYMTSAAEVTLAELVARHPALAGEFERLGFDYCCHGDRTLAESCAASGLPLQEALTAVVREVNRHDRPYEVHWPELCLVDLVDHIQDVHHRYLHLELPFLVALSARALSADSGHHPELTRVDALVGSLNDELIPHLAREENIVFPAIRDLAAGHGGFSFGTVSNPIAVVMAEHDRIAEVLRELRETTSGFAAPQDATQHHRRLYERLSAVESDTHVHVMKENSFLFPRAVVLEAALGERSVTPTAEPTTRAGSR